jgi:hypothetical protein
MPPTDNDSDSDIDITPEQQHNYFYTTFIILVGILVCNLLLTILFSVFNFYNFDYTDFYSVIIFYIFMLTCRLVLPTIMPYEINGLENVTSSIQQSASSAYGKMMFSMREDPELQGQPPGVFPPRDQGQGQVIAAQPQGVVQSRPVSHQQTDDTKFLIPSKSGTNRYEDGTGKAKVITD